MDHAYENREAAEFRRQMDRAEKGTLAERKEAAANFLEAMRDNPSLVGERVEWLIDGSYGYGAGQAAKRTLASRDKVAQLNAMIGALEWMCPPRMVADAWKKLSAAEKAMLDAAIKRAIKRSAED